MLGSAPESVRNAMSSANWLDAHYLACESEYQTMLRAAGIKPGWHVLDAGCGSGSFLPAMAELVGPQGRISAIDLAPEHIAAVRGRAESDQFACPVNASVGDVKALPFDDAAFDLIWNANVAQYLTEPELRQTLSGFRRVLRPGGALAIKDGDITALQILPIPPTLLWRLLDAWVRRGDQQIAGLLGSLSITRHLGDAGFIHVSRRVTFIERSAPLRRAEAQFVAELVALFAQLSSELELSTADREHWQRFGNVQSENYILTQSELYLREAAVLVIGYEPSR